MNVIRLTNNKGCPSPSPGKSLKTLLGSGHLLVAKRVVPYAMSKAPKVKESLIKKYHILNFPYSTLNGLLPPFQVCEIAVVLAMLFKKVSFANLLADAQNFVKKIFLF